MDHLHQREPMAAGRAVGIGMWLGCWLVPFTDFDPRRPRLPWSYPLALAIGWACGLLGGKASLSPRMAWSQWQGGPEGGRMLVGAGWDGFDRQAVRALGWAAPPG